MLTPQERLACALYAISARAPEELREYMEVHRGKGTVGDVETLWQLPEDHIMRLSKFSRKRYLEAAATLMSILEEE